MSDSKKEDIEDIIGKQEDTPIVNYKPKPLPSMPKRIERIKMYPEPIQSDTQVVVNNTWHTFLVAFFLIVLIAFLGSMTYLVWKGKFQSNVSQDLNITTNVTTNNQYSFNPSTNNQYSFTIPVNVTIINRVYQNTT